jgi:hypothetical protein
MLATLLETTPDGRSWPTTRDTWSLLIGGLRVRAAQNRQLPLHANLRLAGLLAAALWLISAMDGYLVLAIRPLGPNELFIPDQPPLSSALFAVCALAACLAIASAWLWRRRVTVTLALAVVVTAALAYSQARGITTLSFGTSWPFDVHLIGPPLALAALAAGKDRPPRRWLVDPCRLRHSNTPGLYRSRLRWAVAGSRAVHRASCHRRRHPGLAPRRCTAGSRDRLVHRTALRA